MDSLEKIIRPIVEGQIRGFGKEHLPIVQAVDWYAPREDKLQTLVNSLSKRITWDLLCSETRMRMAATLLEVPTDGVSENMILAASPEVISPRSGTQPGSGT